MKAQADCCYSKANSLSGEAHANNIIKVGSQKTYRASITRIIHQLILFDSVTVCSEKQSNLTDKFCGQTLLFNVKAIGTQLILHLRGLMLNDREGVALSRGSLGTENTIFFCWITS